MFIFMITELSNKANNALGRQAGGRGEREGQYALCM